MDHQKTARFVDTLWENRILPTMKDYIRIPNQSPLYDTAWRENGHMNAAVELARTWVERQKLQGIRVEVHQEGDRTPIILLEVAGGGDRTVLMYGHLDKQPPMTGWEPGFGPWTPVIRDGKLYGRGGADDGYAIFASVGAILALHDQAVEHSRIVVLIECCEESGSLDLPFYIEALADRIRTPSLVICLDSGCGNYDQLWVTTSLRGAIVGNLKVEVLTEGVHSGDAGGIVPSSFRIIRLLLDRLEDASTGRIRPEWLTAEVPEARMAEVRTTAAILGREVFDNFPFVDGMQPAAKDPVELLLNRTWRPSLSITGQAGLPDLVQGGNVLRPSTSLKLSLRLPPSLNADGIDRKLTELFQRDAPYGAHVTFEPEKGGSGWQAPAMAEWLERSISAASRAFFGTEPASFGEGGSIPFMGMLGERYPEAQFVITGVLGPRSNAHGPNEFLHIPTAKNLTASIASVLADERKNGG